MAETLIDSYSETNQSGTGTLYSDEPRWGQSFTGLSKKLSTCKFYLKKTGSPTGNLTAAIYAHTGTYGTSSLPTGTVLGTSDVIDVSTLTTSLALITFTFTGANQYAMGANYYCIEANYSGGDASNRVDPGYDNTSPTHGGNCYRYTGGLEVLNTIDLCFYVYGVPISSGFLVFF